MCVCFFCAADTRLVGGPDDLSGRVEVRHNGVWGTVCDDGWDDPDAFVVCQSLGYSGGTAREGGAFGRGRGPIWLANVNCDGTERTVTECPHGGWGGHDCLHKEDAGVVCSPAGACAVPPPSFVGPLLFEGFRGGVTKCWLGMLRNDAVLLHICVPVAIASLCHTFTVFMGICECTARPAPPLLLQVAFH